MPPTPESLNFQGYCPDKTFLGVRNEAITLFEAFSYENICKDPSLDPDFAISENCYKLKPGILMGLQLSATECRLKGCSVAKLVSKKSSLIDRQDEVDAAKVILSKLQPKLVSHHTTSIKVSFKNKSAYVECPGCNKLRKVTRRGKRFEIWSTETHIKACLQSTVKINGQEGNKNSQPFQPSKPKKGIALSEKHATLSVNEGSSDNELNRTIDTLGE